MGLRREMWNQHALQRTCPRCGYWDVAVAPKVKVNGSEANISCGMKTTRYACKECNMIFEEAD